MRTSDRIHDLYSLCKGIQAQRIRSRGTHSPLLGGKSCFQDGCGSKIKECRAFFVGPTITFNKTESTVGSKTLTLVLDAIGTIQHPGCAFVSKCVACSNQHQVGSQGTYLLSTIYTLTVDKPLSSWMERASLHRTSLYPLSLSSTDINKSFWGSILEFQTSRWSLWAVSVSGTVPSLSHSIKGTDSKQAGNETQE